MSKVKSVARYAFAFIGLVTVIYMLVTLPGRVEYARAVDSLRASDSWYVTAESTYSVEQTVTMMHRAHDAHAVWTARIPGQEGTWVTVDESKLNELAKSNYRLVSVSLWR